MIKSLFLFIVFSSSALVSFSQENSQVQKECRITGGLGFAGAAKNNKSLGQDVWLQLDYKLSENISIATEFENMAYKQPGYYENLLVKPNEIKVVDNNFSLLFKYHLPINSALKIALASGWTFTTRQNDYYIFEVTDSSQEYFRNVTSFSDYRIPLLVEVEYPVSKKINIQARAKYNLNPQNGDTYSGGIGLSLKL